MIPSREALVVGALLLLYPLFSGTLPGGATFGGRALGLLILGVTILVLGLPAPRWHRPSFKHGMGFMILGVFLLSWVRSPVPRAGLFPVVFGALLGLLVLALRGLPERTQERLRPLLGATGLLLASTALGWWLWDREPLAQPSGHHQLLALQLVLLWPFCWAPKRSPWLRTALLLPIFGVIVGTRSLGALVALGIQILCLLPGRLRWIALVLILGGVGFNGDRIAAIGRGEDQSWSARAVYWKGGIKGSLQRPGLGWGPGSTPWLISEYLEPDPRVNPPYEVVGDLHSLPLRILFETGIPTLLGLVLVLVWVLRTCWRRGPPGRLAVVAVGGAILATLTSGTLGTSAPWVLLAVILGLHSPRVDDAIRSPAASVLVLLLFLPLIPSLRAHAAWDRWVRFEDPTDLATAVRLDSEFPLYRAHQAWRQSDGDEAWRAAKGNRIPALWLAAGLVVDDSSEELKTFLLERATRLDPLGALAPAALGSALPGDSGAIWAARAALSDPRVLAHSQFRAVGIREEVASALERWPGVDAGWRTEILQRYRRSWSREPEETLRLDLKVDREAARSLSLLVFCRRPKPIAVVGLEVSRGALSDLDLVPALSVSTTTTFSIPQPTEPFARE